MAEVRDLIRTFKAMMSIHEARLGDGDRGDDRRRRRWRRATPSPSASWPPCRAWSSSRSGSSAPRLSWNTLAQGLDEAEARRATAASRLTATGAAQQGWD